MFMDQVGLGHFIYSPIVPLYFRMFSINVFSIFIYDTAEIFKTVKMFSKFIMKTDFALRVVFLSKSHYFSLYSRHFHVIRCFVISRAYTARCNSSSECNRITWASAKRKVFEDCCLLGRPDDGGSKDL
jgi:hypothetical protein